MNDDEWPGLRFAREAVRKSNTRGEYDSNARLLGELLHPIRDVYESNPGLRFARVAVLKSTEEGEYAVHARMFQELLQTRVQSQPEQENTSSPGAVNAVDPEVQAEVDALAVQIMEAAEQRKKNKDRLELLLSTEDQRKNDQSEQTMYTGDPENFVPGNGTGCVPGGLTKLRQSVELCGDCKTQVENLKRSNDPLVTFELFRPCPTCLSAAISICPPCEADIHGDGRNRANDGHGKVNYPMLKNKTPRLQIQRHRAADGKLVCKQCWTNFYRGWSTSSTSGPKRKYGTGSVVCRTTTSGRERWEAVIVQNKERKELGMYDTKVEAENACDSYLEDPDGFVAPPRLKRRKGTGSVVCTKSTSGRERWEAVIVQNKERKVLGVYDTKVEALNACDSYLEDPDGFVAPPLLRRRKGTGSVKPSKYGRRFTTTYKDKHIGTFDTETEADDAVDAIRGTSKTDPATCSTPGLEDLAMLENFVPEIGPKRKYGTGSVVCRKYTSGRERWEAVIGQNKKRKSLGLYDTKVEAENACDSYLEDPDGFVRPPLLRRRKGMGSVVCTKYTSGRERWRVIFIQNKERKDLGLYDTKEEAENARGRYLEDPEGFVVPPLLCGTGKTNPVTSSTSGLKDLAMVAALEQPASPKRPRGDDEEDVEKFTNFEIGHLVFARSGKSNWAPAQISAISTSDKICGWPGARMGNCGHRVYDVEFFVKEKNGVYPRAQNLPLSKLEAADEDTFEKHSGRCKSKNWVEGMKEFRRVYDKSRRV